jgi:lysophospholipase L1-like esterase
MFGGPGGYRIETSADSTDGKNGTWKVALTVEDNQVMNRAHAVEFTGQRWLRFLLTAKSARTYEHGVQLDALQLYDISKGGEDTWLFVGDSITAETFPGGRVNPSFAARIRARVPAFTPVVLTAGQGFFKVSSLLEKLPKWLELNTDVMTWAICIGSNDNPNDPVDFRRDLEALVKALQAAGKTVVLARIPWQRQSDVKWLNAEIDTVTEKYKLPRGPDLHSYFKAHPDQLRDGLHPTPEGALAIHALWTEAMLPLYGL